MRQVGHQRGVIPVAADDVVTDVPLREVGYLVVRWCLPLADRTKAVVLQPVIECAGRPEQIAAKRRQPIDIGLVIGAKGHEAAVDLFQPGAAHFPRRLGQFAPGHVTTESEDLND